MKLKSWLKENILFIALTQAAMATLGSLYFSEVKHFLPCILCWYQRICMYPITILLLAGILRMDKKIYWYILPLSILGMGVALFHNLLYYNIIPEAAAPCQAGVSCTTKFIEWFGFVTIPFLSFLAFTVITLCMILYKNWNK